MNEILDGIKVIKLYAWEPSFAKSIHKIRDEEVSTLKKMSYLGAAQTFMFTAAPMIVAVSSFATFVLIDEANILNAEIAFVSLSYFNLMRQPLNQVLTVKSILVMQYCDNEISFNWFEWSGMISSFLEFQ